MPAATPCQLPTEDADESQNMSHTSRPHVRSFRRNGRRSSLSRKFGAGVPSGLLTSAFLIQCDTIPIMASLGVMDDAVGLVGAGCGKANG